MYRPPRSVFFITVWASLLCCFWFSSVVFFLSCYYYLSIALMFESSHSTSSGPSTHVADGTFHSRSCIRTIFVFPLLFANPHFFLHSFSLKVRRRPLTLFLICLWTSEVEEEGGKGQRVPHDNESHTIASAEFGFWFFSGCLFLVSEVDFSFSHLRNASRLI